MAEDTKAEWPEGDLETLDRCPVCDSRDHSLLHEEMRDWNFGCAAGEWTQHLCGQCFSAFLNPRPTPATIGKAYDEYYTHSAALDAPPKSLGQRLRSALANDYRNWRYGTAYRPAIFGGRYIPGVAPDVAITSDIDFAYLPGRRTENARVLEIGPGGGGFLRRARDAGWIASGVEPDPVSARGLREDGFVIYSGMDELFAQGTQFEAVVMSHSIEHLHDPKKVMAQVFNLMAPGGHLFVDTPNLGSLGHRTYGKFWAHLDAPRHLVVFNPKSLSEMLSRIGFDSIEQHPRPEIQVSDRFVGSSTTTEPNPLSAEQIGQAGFNALFREHFVKDAEYLTFTAAKPKE